MTCFCRRALISFLLLGAAGPAGAGVYNLAEPEEGKLNEDYLRANTKFNPPVPSFHKTLLDFKDIYPEKIAFDYPLRMRYRLAADLAGKSSTAKLSVLQKINLSAALIRCHRYDEAVNLLTPLAAQHRDNFFVHANLGTAYQHVAQQEGRAINSLEQALSVWPKDINQLSEEKQRELSNLGFAHMYHFYRKVEEYHLKLLKLRAREGAREADNVDALFDDGQKPATPVKFVGETGDFEPWTMARAEKAKLDALKDFSPLDIVQQLLIWLPDDQRLYWLLAELYNARGDVENSRYIFEKLGDLQTGLRVKEFRSRMQILLKAPVPESDIPSPDDLDAKLKQTDDQKSKLNALVDFRSLAVGGLIGAAVALFTLWQVREWRRRKQRDLSTNHRV